MRTIITALTPVAILLSIICIAGVLGYLLATILGDTFPLAKIISKTTLILLVLSVFPIMAWLHLNKKDIGFSSKTIFFKQMAKGLLLGIIILLPVIISLWFLDLWYYDQYKNWTAVSILLKVLGIFVIAFLVAAPEELIFRGVLLTGLSKKIGVFLGISVSALYFAGLHFLKTKIEIPVQELSLMSSYIITADAFNNLFQLSNLSAFIALFTVAVFLSCVRMRLPQSLGLCIGIHAGWVFLIKVTSAFFDKNRLSDLKFLVSSYDGIIGPLVSAWLILLTAFFLYVMARGVNNKNI
jgi:membrane protease YdiL (CAAX protease family)